MPKPPPALLPWPTWIVIVLGLVSLPFLYQAAKKEQGAAASARRAELLAAEHHDREVLCQARCGPDRVLLCELVPHPETHDPVAITVCSAPGRDPSVWALWP